MNVIEISTDVCNQTPTQTLGEGNRSRREESIDILLGLQDRSFPDTKARMSACELFPHPQSKVFGYVLGSARTGLIFAAIHEGT